MRICLLSYDAPHLKTAQVTLGLMNRGFRNIDFMLMPFIKRNERNVFFQHRPFQFEGPDPLSLASFTRGKIIQYKNWRNVACDYDWFLVCGSNLIEADFAKTCRILNVHSGLIPSVRGLDSFKWAILNNKPLGNTLHIIDEKADAGQIISHLYTPIFPADNLRLLANRHYENEIWMITHFDELIIKGKSLELPQSEPTMRMPSEKELDMIHAFDDYKARCISNAFI